MRIESNQGALYPVYLGFAPGMGDVSVNDFTGAAKIGAGTAISTGSMVSGGVASGLAIAASFDPEPFSKAALAIGAALTGIITNMLKGCGQTCIDASNYANQAEPLLVQNVSNYVSQSVRYKSMQAQALANFDQVFTALEQKCQQVGGQGGTNCIKDRVAGACKWKASPWTWTRNSDGSFTYTPAGPSGSGSQCWNWVYGYRDSIAADPSVTPDPVTGNNAVDSVLGSISSLFAGGTVGSATIAGIPLPLALLAAGFILYEVNS